MPLCGQQGFAPIHKQIGTQSPSAQSLLCDEQPVPPGQKKGLCLADARRGLQV